MRIVIKKNARLSDEIGRKSIIADVFSGKARDMAETRKLDRSANVADTLVERCNVIRPDRVADEDILTASFLYKVIDYFVRLNVEK